MEIKRPSTFKQQLQIIEKRGCEVNNEEAAINFLRQVNYYRLTAYFLPFKTEGDKYKEGTTFERICAIYEFDRKLRNIIFSAVEEIEIMLRTQLSYYHAHKYGALGYLEARNYNQFHNHEAFIKHIDGAIEHNENLLFVRHHKENYDGNFPIWVIIELFSMGELSFFFSDMLREDKKKIAREVFDTYDNYLSSWLKCLTNLRNYCAHYSRLYYFLFPAIPATPKVFPYTMGKKLFDYLLMLKLLYRDKNKWDNSFMVQLTSLIDEYTEYICLEHIGFPDDWEKLLKWNYHEITLKASILLD